jgi:hypothetical protein
MGRKGQRAGARPWYIVLVLEATGRPLLTTPLIERDSLGHSLPSAALNRLDHSPIRVKFVDRLFFPVNVKHTKCPTSGHICHVQRKIVAWLSMGANGHQMPAIGVGRFLRETSL